MAPEQCRAARAWLKLSMEDLALASNVAITTIRDFEAGRKSRHDPTLVAVKTALESRGVVFVDGANTKGIVVSQRSRMKRDDSRALDFNAGR